MKSILLSLVFLFSLNIYSQDIVKFEKVDSVKKTSAQIYSATKLFIANTWRSAKDVIQNDDKESGNILVKGTIIENVTFFGSVYRYVYTYNVTFKMKDSKCKISIDNIFCDKAYHVASMKDIVRIPVFLGEDCPEISGDLFIGSISRKKAIEMMEILRMQLNDVTDNYIKFVKTETDNSDW